jgi:hypothetical protein
MPRPAARLAGGAFVALLLAAAFAQPADAQKVRISNLADVNFGTIANLQADSRQSQSICVYSQGAGGAYSVTASGSGGGSAFTLANGAFALPYEVQWSPASGQANGTTLSANVALSGQTSTATQQTCNSGPANSASLIVVLRSAALSQARMGSYNGTLTLVIAAE